VQPVFLLPSFALCLFVLWHRASFARAGETRPGFFMITRAGAVCPGVFFVLQQAIAQILRTVVFYFGTKLCE